MPRPLQRQMGKLSVMSAQAGILSFNAPLVAARSLLSIVFDQARRTERPDLVTGGMRPVAARGEEARLAPGR
jgi:hypothetical protein